MGNELEYWADYFERAKTNMLIENYDAIRKHIRQLKAKGMRERTLVNHYQFLTHFGIWCKAPFKNLTEEEILDYCEVLDKQKYKEGTKYVKLATIKAFLKNINNEATKAITIKPQKSKKLPEDLLTQQDIETLLKNCGNNRDRALIATLYESGMRKGELFSIKIKNIQFDENGAVITIPEGKTGARRIRVIFASSFLREWIEVHPIKENREASVFCSLRAPYKTITSAGLHDQLVRIAEKAHVQKRINPHSFRHARATHLAEHLTEQQLKNYLGWTQGSSMAQVYVHLSGKDMDNAILKMNGINIDETHTDGLKVGRCPRCKELNPERAQWCNKCGLPLQNDFKDNLNKELTEIDMLVMEAIAKDPKVLQALTERINKHQKGNE